MPAFPMRPTVVSVDETRNYEIDPADRPLIDRICGIYLCDRGQATNCAELTPSYWCVHVADVVFLTDEAAAAADASPESEAARSALYGRYEHCGGADIYVHCHTVDAQVDRQAAWDAATEKVGLNPWCAHVYPDDDGVARKLDLDVESEREELFEEYREHVQGNNPLG